MFYRSAIGCLLMTAFARWQGLSLKTAVPGMHFWRAASGITALCLWFYVIGKLPLATAMTLNYMSSVWMALFLMGGAVMLGAARLDGRLIATVLVGFAGVALILRPTIEQNQLWYGLVGLLSGMISATAYLQVTALGRAGEPEGRVVFYFSLGGGRGGAGLDGFHRLQQPQLARCRAAGRRRHHGHGRAVADDPGLRHRPNARQRQPAVPGHRLLVCLRRAAVR